jgi:hypothetical protein
MRGGILNELAKNELVLPQDAERLLQIRQLEIVGLYRIGDAGFRYFYFRLFRVGVAFGYCASQPSFPG